MKKKCPLCGHEIEKESRSLKQNTYLFGVVYKMVSDHTGFTTEEVHQVYKAKFLKYRKEYQGKLFNMVRSTTELTIKEFSDFVEQVRQHAAQELGIVIPDPGEY